MRHRGDRPRQVPWQVALSRQAPWHNLMQHHTATQPTRGLEDMPSSWLHQLIPSLPPKDTLALFQTCRQLSQMVVFSSPLISLQLHGSLEWKPKRSVREQTVYILFLYLLVYILLSVPSWCQSHMHCRPTAWIITVGGIFLSHISMLMHLLMIWSARRRAGRIVRILSGSHNLKVKLKGTLPVPRQLYCQITVLAIHDHVINGGPGEYINRCRWEDLAALQQLTLDNVSGRALQQLGSALQAGHLKQLRKLSLYPNGLVKADYMYDRDFAETAVIKLGYSLTHLATNRRELWACLRNFTALQSVEIGPGQLQSQPEKQLYTELSADVLCQLCEHPTLRTVTLRACTLSSRYPDVEVMGLEFADVSTGS